MNDAQALASRREPVLVTGAVGARARVRDLLRQARTRDHADAY